VRLVACVSCHSQYDVTDIVAKTFACRCGETVENQPPEPRDAAIRRCAACGALADSGHGRCDYCSASLIRDPAEKLSLICPECYARNAEKSRFCGACGVTFSPYPVRITGPELPCPGCSMLMPAREIGGVPINECPGCHGLWVPGGDFEVLVERATEARRNIDPADLPALTPRVTGGNPLSQRVQYRNCPECDALMQRRNYRKSSGVILDRCAPHGTWLDADELEQIAGFILSGRSATPSPAHADSKPVASLPADPHFNWRSSDPGSNLFGSLADSLFALLK
jgi:Zn-finger nucleic acid-binding protein